MRRATAIVLIGGLLACGKEETATGTIEMSWTGADTGRLEAPASARWCAADTAVEIAGIEGDSGAGVAVFPLDTIAPGEYTVAMPGEELPRPRAGVALRRFGENLVLGYYSVSGKVVVESGARLNGTLDATLRELNTGDTLNVTGRFTNLAVQPGAGNCGAPNAGTPTDTVVR